MHCATGSHGANVGVKMKYISLNDRLYSYVCQQRSNAGDPVLADLRRETELLGDESRMQISPEQGSFMTVLTRLIGARSAIEVGTFTGYSSICLARGLSEHGKLICVDESKEWTDIARRYWVRAGVDSRIELRLGAALSVLRELEAEPAFDLAFIDADKTEYDGYFELLLPHIRPNGVILFDNMLWGGRLGDGPLENENGKALDALNRKLSRDSRVETVLLPVADGIQVCRKK